MEVLIYTAILSITGTMLSGVLLNTTRIKSRQTAVIEVNEQLNFVLQNIQRSIADSSVIDITNGVSTSTLILKFKNETKNPTKFYIADSIIYKKEASGAAQPLTNDSVIATAVNFLKVSGYSGHDSVQIDLTLTYNTTNPTSAFSRTLSSAIARVSAATFDSDLIPGSSIHDIGTSAAKWQDLYVSGITNFGGVDYTWPAADGTSGQNLFTNGAGVLSWSTPPGGWTAASGKVYTTTITDKVGIGTTTPGNLLHVQGSQAADFMVRLRNTAANGQSSITYYDDAGTWQGYSGYDNNSNKWIWTSVTASDISINTNNDQTKGVYIKSDGNVGIGTTNPSTKLEIQKTSVTAGEIARFSGIQATNNTGYYMQFTGGSAGATPLAQVGFTKTGSGNPAVWTNEPADHAFLAGSGGVDIGSWLQASPSISIIGASGNVGIGTTNPLAKLGITGLGTYNTPTYTPIPATDAVIYSSEMTDNNAHSILQLLSVRQSLSTGNGATGYLGFSTMDDSNAEGIVDAGRIAIVNEAPTARNSPTALSFWTNSATGGLYSNPATEKVRITSSGNVGIGTTNPDTGKLQINNLASGSNGGINGTTNPTRLVVNGNFPALTLGYYSSGYGLDLWVGTGGLAPIYFDQRNKDAIIFRVYTATTPTEVMKINSYNSTEGNVVIGTSTAAGKLHVDSLGVTQALNHLGGSTSNVFTNYSVGGTIIGSVSSSNWTSVLYNTTSDRRLKENVTITTTGLSTLLQIPVNDFNFITDPSKSRTQGFIAQDLLKYYPEAVMTNGDNGIDTLNASSTPWSVDYGRLTPLLVKSIQEQQKQIEELKAEISELKLKIK